MDNCTLELLDWVFLLGRLYIRRTVVVNTLSRQTGVENSVSTWVVNATEVLGNAFWYQDARKSEQRRSKQFAFHEQVTNYALLLAGIVSTL